VHAKRCALLTEVAPVWRYGFQLYHLISAIARLQQEGPVDCVTSDAFYTNCTWAIMRPKVDAEPMTVRPASGPFDTIVAI